jgi:hypothetical protein
MLTIISCFEGAERGGDKALELCPGEGLPSLEYGSGTESSEIMPEIFRVHVLHHMLHVV